MKHLHVKLPIYNDKGEQLPQHLEVSTALLEYLASISIHWKDHVEVVQLPTPEQEKEMIDRIIAGLPTRPFFEEFDVDFNRYEYRLPTEEKTPSAHYRLHEDGRIEQLVKHENLEWGPPPPVTEKDIDFNEVQLVDVSSAYPAISKKLRTIPGFSQYKMDSLGRVYDKDDKTVSIVKGGRIDNVLLSNDDGINKRMSIDFLFKKTFPEYQ